jgi:TRAP-type C4-dicarboxylate transport system permease small subunit
MMEEKTNRKTGILEKVVERGGFLGVMGMAFMVASISYDVAMRYFFSAPTHWALEVNTFLLVFLCVVPAADVLKAGGQIRITFLTDRLRPKTRRVLDSLRASAGILFCAVMTWKGAVMAFQAWQHNDRMSTSLGTPMVIPYLLLPIGFGLLGIQYLTFLMGKRKRPDQTSGKSSGEPEAEVGQQI